MVYECIFGWEQVQIIFLEGFGARVLGLPRICSQGPEITETPLLSAQTLIWALGGVPEQS